MIVSIVNQKGGVGKTSTTVNLGAALALMNKSVLLVDMDPQGAVATTFGLQPDMLDKTLYEVMFKKLPVEEAIIQTKVKNLSILPSNLQMARGEVELINNIGGEYFLRKVVNSIKQDYDLVFIDTPPSLSLLSINALVTSDSVLIPVACDILSLRGMENLLEQIAKVKEVLNPSLTILGIIINMYDSRTLHSRESKEVLYQQFGDQIRIFKTVIMNTTKVKDAWGAREPLLLFDKKCKAAGQYRELAKEVWNAVEEDSFNE